MKGLWRGKRTEDYKFSLRFHISFAGHLLSNNNNNALFFLYLSWNVVFHYKLFSICIVIIIIIVIGNTQELVSKNDSTASCVYPCCPLGGWWWVWRCPTVNARHPGYRVSVFATRSCRFLERKEKLLSHMILIIRKNIYPGLRNGRH